MKGDETPFMVAAFVLHLALPVAAYVAPEAVKEVVATVRSSQEVDIDVTELPPLAPHPLDDNVPLPTSEDGTTQDLDAPIGGRVTRPLRRSAAQAAAPLDPNEKPSGDPRILTADGNHGDGPAFNGDYNLPPSAGDIGGPGAFGSGPLWARPGMVPGENPGRPGAPTRAPQRTEDPHAGTKALREAMRKKDSSLGLDLPAASAIAGVIRRAVRSSETPYECTASITVTLSGAGNVTAVSLNSFSGGGPAVWQTVRKTVLAQLQGVNYPMKSAYEKGAIIGYGVSSVKKTPGGGTGRDGLTLKFDVADIGARATRQVKVGWSARPAS